MGKDSSPPPAPDYTQAAKDTAAGNLQYARYSTMANRPTEITPLGSRTWTQGGGAPTFDQAGYDAAMAAYTKGLAGGGNVTRDDMGNVNGYYGEGNNWIAGAPPAYSGQAPNRDQFWNTGGNPDQWTSTISLTPEGQGLFDQQMRLSKAMGDLSEQQLSRVQGETSKPFDYSSINDLVDKAQAAYMARLDPVLARARAAQEQVLANQGSKLGMESYGTAQDILGKQENDARGQAILQAMQLSPQLLSQALTLRNQPLNELNAFRTGSQVSMPQFQNWSPQATVAGPNYSGAAQNQAQYNQGAYNAQTAQSNAMMGGLFSLGGALAGLPVAGGGSIGGNFINGLMSPG